MNKTRALYKAFGSNLEMPRPNGEKKVKLYNRFGMIAFIGIMVPVSVLVGYITYIVTNLIFVFGGDSYGLVSELNLISAFAMIFGMALMFSVLFFSSDLQFLTALPLSPATLYRARFWHTFKAENVMTSNVLFAIYIGYYVAAIKHRGIGDALNPIGLIAALTGFFGSLLIPLIYCSILAMLLMLALRRFNRSDIYYNSSLLLFVAFTLMFCLSFRSYGRISMTNYLDTLVGGNNSFNSICNFLFPTNYLTTLTVQNHSVLPLVGSLLIIVVLYLLSVLVAHLTYRKGLFAAAVISNKKTSRRSSSACRSHRLLPALIMKETRILMRTMTYRMNCVYANLLWPIAALILAVEAPRFEPVKEFIYKLQNGDKAGTVVIFAIFAGMAFIASGLNSIASTSFTREGVHIDMLKYLPAPIGKQILAKVSTAVLFTFIPEVIAVMIIAIRIGNAKMLPLYIPVSFVCILTATIIGVVMDSVSPYTVWSDELSALRGNLNCFFNLAAEMLAALLIGLLSYVIYKLSGSDVITITAATLLLLIACAGCIFVGLPKARSNIESLK